MSPTAKYPANSFRPSARPRRFGPTRSTFMITVIDHAMAWFAPSKTFARSIHHHAGAWIMRNGTGRANSHPTTRIGLRPMRSDARAATRLMTAFVTPKLTMNEVMAVFEVSPNSCSPRSGSTVRSKPTMAPTKAFSTTRRVNCGRFPAVRAASRSFAGQVAPPVEGEDLRLWRKVRQHEPQELRLRRELERGVEAALEADRRAGLPAQAFAAGCAAEVRGIDLDVIRKLQQLVVDTLVELLGERRFRPLTQEIGPSHTPREERVPGENKPRLRPPRPVGHDDRHTIGRVPGRVQERHTDVPHLVLFAIRDAHVREVDVGRLMEEHRRAGGRGQPPGARDVVGLDVGLDDVGDAH